MEEELNSNYLKIFPSWKVDLSPKLVNGLSAGEIRNRYFD